MSSYNDIKNLSDEAEQKRGADKIRADKIAQENFKAIIASVHTDIYRELTQIGKAFGYSGLFGRFWGIERKQFSREDNQFSSCVWVLHGEYESHIAVCIQLQNRSGFVPELSLYGCDLYLLNLKKYGGSKRQIPGEAEVKNKISEFITKLNRQLCAFHIQERDLKSK